MKILGLHREPWHDTGAAILYEKDNEIKIVSISQERIDRVKNSRACPMDAINYCMKEAGINSFDEIDLIVSDYIEIPVWNKDSIVQGDFHPLLGGFSEGRKTEVISAPCEKIAIINHHQAHAASAFYSSSFEESAILIVDGRGSDKETQSIYTASRKEGVRLLEKSDALGLGLLYATITEKIGFGILCEGKTMGLAPYGNQNANKNISWDKRIFNGVHTDYRNICCGRYDLVEPLPKITDEIKANLAFEVQNEIENAMIYLARHAKKITGLDNLCIIGGVGLNSVANYKILQENIFKEIYIQPACSDTGIPFGCALHGYYHILKGTLPHNFTNPYLGRKYTHSEVTEAIEDSSGYDIIKENVFEQTLKLIIENKVVGWYHGGSEIGPRALGNRSILMSPLKAENKDILNDQVKHRESFRPFAPVVLEEKVSDYFILDRPAPYMLLVPPVRDDKRDEIPAVTHVDGTGRVQTISQKMNKKYYDIIKAFGDRTGTYVLLNTSFNVAGEPIVETPEDAIRCFLGTGIDALCIEDYLLIKNDKS